MEGFGICQRMVSQRVLPKVRLTGRSGAGTFNKGALGKAGDCVKKLVLLFFIAVALIGCQAKHPRKVFVNPSLQPEAIEKVAVFSFTSVLHQADDPDQEAPTMLEKFFMPQLDTRDDYNFIGPRSVEYAINAEDLGEQTRKFLREWPMSKQPDTELLSKLAQRLDCDAFLIPVVDLWQKDEADFQENTTPATYVGATISLIDAKSGDVLFEASDEDYLEGARTETGDRTLVVGASGNVQSDFGAKTHKAPPFEGVVQKVVIALVSSLPVR